MKRFILFFPFGAMILGAILLVAAGFASDAGMTGAAEAMQGVGGTSAFIGFMFLLGYSM